MAHHPEEPGTTSSSSHLRQEGQSSEAALSLSAITRLYELSTRLVLSSGLESLLDEILHAVIELHGANFGNVQLYDPESETLSIVAQQGFNQPFLDCFRVVDAHDSSACGLALARRERVIIGDTETDPAYQAFRHMAALSGYRAVQSTPLFTRAGEILGMLSTHFRLPHHLSAYELSLTDLYARQAAEMIERHRMQEELKRINEALKEAERLKDEFIGIAAHELRNPLAALMGFASMLTYQSASNRGPALADWQREALSEIEQATARLDKLTEDLLDVTRLQAGRLVLSLSPTGLVDLVRQQVRLAQMTTQRHVISFETMHSELLAEVDRGRIEQVVSNLLSNAIKYSPQGGSIVVALRREGEHSFALLQVADQGIGIPMEQQGKLFGRFVRAENARTTEITGTGLGLYLSRELIKQHGGQLWFESVEGAGSTFFLRLPLS